MNFMRKNIFLLIISLLLINCICLADINSRIETDEELETCLEKSENYIQKTQCNYKATEKYNKEINEALNDLKSLVSESQYEEITKSQEYWNNFYKQNDVVLKQTLEADFQHELLFASSRIKCANTKARAMDLTYMLFNLKYNKKN